MALSDLASIRHDGRLVTDDKAMAHVYAAYRRGGLVLSDAQADLDPESFGLMFGRWLQQLIGGGSQAIVISARVRRKEDFPKMDEDYIREHDLDPITETMPVGLVLIDYQGVTAYPDIHWFPEASPRNRLESTLYLMLELKKEHMVFFTVPGTKPQPGEEPQPDWKFLMHLCKYGVLRPVGTIRDHGGPGDHATLFQSVGT